MSELDRVSYVGVVCDVEAEMICQQLNSKGYHRACTHDRGRLYINRAYYRNSMEDEKGREGRCLPWPQVVVLKAPPPMVT
jgi:hypothetical protein